MATRTAPADPDNPPASDPSAMECLAALVIALAGVLATRLPVARPAAYDFDEVGFLGMIQDATFPKGHTLFLAAAHLVGDLVGDAYRGFVLLDAFTSALALVAVWWWLRAVVGRATAAAGALALGAAPVFWSYGAMAGNYTAIVLVGSVLLGIAWRSRNAPQAWHPYAAAVALALGAGYRQDIGVFWLPVFLVILWQHRGLAAAQAGLLFVAVNLAWFVPMLRDAGGWNAWRAASREFAHKAGYLNSYWHLGFIDAPLRYAVKAAMALVWTLGPGLLFVPRGILRLRRTPSGFFLATLFALSVAPALASHLLIHFGVAGYAFHYVPALMALMALGISPRPAPAADRPAAFRLVALASFLAAVFLCYPTNYNAPGVRSDFDLAFARHTRIGLRTEPPMRDPRRWRTIESQQLPEGAPPATARRQSLWELLR